MDFEYEYGTKLQYAAITVETTIDANDLRYPQGLPLREDWEDWFDDEVGTSTCSSVTR